LENLKGTGYFEKDGQNTVYVCNTTGDLMSERRTKKGRRLEAKLLDFHKLFSPHDKFVQLSDHEKQIISHFLSNYNF
jgi:hypothetical protein